MTYKLPDAKTIFAALALMAKKERARPRRAKRRVDHMEQQRRARVGARKRKERLQREATARAAVRRSEQWAARVRAWHPIQTIGERIMMVMEPGKWYGARDLAYMADLGGPAVRNARATLIQKLMGAGMVERARNPAYVGVPSPQVAMVTDVEPMWLYRLTAAGEAASGRLRSSGGTAPLSPREEGGP